MGTYGSPCLPSHTSQRHPLPSHSSQNYPPPLENRSFISQNSQLLLVSASSHVPSAPLLTHFEGLLPQPAASCELSPNSPIIHAKPPGPHTLVYSWPLFLP